MYHLALFTNRPWLHVINMLTTYIVLIDGLCKSKVKINRICKLTSPLREITYHIGSHSVACHPAEVIFPPLPQPKPVLDLATPKECKAELT